VSGSSPLAWPGWFEKQLRFIEDNWHTGQIGDAVADATGGSMNAMFKFHHERNDEVLLNEQTGAVATITHNGHGNGN
jgi:phospholipase C